MKATKAKISPERAQDWITSALNPIVDRLQRELHLLPSGRWRWLFTTRDFEYLHEIRDYVAEIYVDNYEDFIAKHPRLLPVFKRHDAALKELRDAVARAFDVLAGDEGSTLRAALEREVEPKGVDKEGQRYFLSYLASGYGELPSSYSDHDVYNALSESIRDQANALLRDARAKAKTAAGELEKIDKKLFEELRSLRIQIADRYGARVMPVND